MTTTYTWLQIPGNITEYNEIHILIRSVTSIWNSQAQEIVGIVYQFDPVLHETSGGYDYSVFAENAEIYGSYAQYLDQAKASVAAQLHISSEQIMETR